MYKQQHITNSEKVCAKHKLQFELRTILCSSTVIEGIYQRIQRLL